MQRFGNTPKHMGSRSFRKTLTSKCEAFSLGAPPKTIWVRAGNCTSAEIEKLLRAAFASVIQFSQQGEETCLILGHLRGDK